MKSYAYSFKFSEYTLLLKIFKENIPGGATRMARGGIRLVHGLTKSTLITYFLGMKKDPKYAFLHGFFLICPSCSFQNLSIWPKHTLFSSFARFCTPKRCTRVQCLGLKNNPNYVNFWTSLIPPWPSSAPPPPGKHSKSCLTTCISRSYSSSQILLVTRMLLLVVCNTGLPASWEHDPGFSHFSAIRNVVLLAKRTIPVIFQVYSTFSNLTDL